MGLIKEHPFICLSILEYLKLILKFFSKRNTIMFLRKAELLKIAGSSVFQIWMSLYINLINCVLEFRKFFFFFNYYV